MQGIVTFQFDDGFLSHYTKAFPIFKKYGARGCIAISSRFRPECAMTDAEALEMQASGWEVLSHAAEHKKMSEYDNNLGHEEIVVSKAELEKRGFFINQFVTPNSVCNTRFKFMLEANYDAAFTVYTNSKELQIEELVIKRYTNRYSLNRACMSGKTVSELKSCIDYVAENGCWINFYDHDIAVGENVTEDLLSDLLNYCIKKNVNILTVSEAIKEYDLT